MLRAALLGSHTFALLFLKTHKLKNRSSNMSQRKGKKVAKPKEIFNVKEMEKPIAFRKNAICIIGGIESGRNKAYHREAIELGRVIALRNMNVVYGGGVLGLSATAAVTAMNLGGKVKAVTIGNVSGSSPTPCLGEEIRVRNAQNRAMSMLLNTDAFVIVPSGIESMELFTTLLTWANFSFHQKPVGFLNVNGFFDGLLTYWNRLSEQGFISDSTYRLIVSASTADLLIQRLLVLMETTSQLMGEPVVPQVEEKRRREGDDPERDGPDTNLKL